jgi:hypothetical protein
MFRKWNKQRSFLFLAPVPRNNAAPQAICRPEYSMKQAVLVLAILSSCAPMLQAQTYMGRMGTGGRPLQAEHAGGTVVVAVAVADGLVLAADSRLTVANPIWVPTYKVASDSAAKLFSVGKVGIATFGEAFILGRSINSFVSESESVGLN